MMSGTLANAKSKGKLCCIVIRVSIKIIQKKQVVAFYGQFLLPLSFFPGSSLLVCFSSSIKLFLPLCFLITRYFEDVWSSGVSTNMNFPVLSGILPANASLFLAYRNTTENN